jgi:hypothetical protein
MAYDDDLAQRVRERLGAEEDIIERTMFGGLAFPPAREHGGRYHRRGPHGARRSR